jgi:hypothetical protein
MASYIENPVFYIKLTNQTLEHAKEVTSCFSRVTLGLQEQNIRPSKASGSCHTCHFAHNCLHRVYLTLGDVKGHRGDIMGLLRPTFKGKGKTPLGPGLPSSLWWNVLLSLRCP